MRITLKRFHSLSYLSKVNTEISEGGFSSFFQNAQPNRGTNNTK